LFESESTERTPGDGIFRKVAMFEVNLMSFTVTVPPVSPETPSVTVVHNGEVPEVGEAAPLAQYPKVSKAV
jgi:hypothetical protein